MIVRQIQSQGIPNCRRMILPLLGGEGRGEGERKLYIPIPAGEVSVTLALILTFSRGERVREWGIAWKTRLLSPALSSLLRREERENASEVQAFADLCGYKCTSPGANPD